MKPQDIRREAIQNLGMQIVQAGQGRHTPATSRATAPAAEHPALSILRAVAPGQVSACACGKCGRGFILTTRADLTPQILSCLSTDARSSTDVFEIKSGHAAVSCSKCHTPNNVKWRSVL